MRTLLCALLAALTVLLAPVAAPAAVPCSSLDFDADGELSVVDFNVAVKAALTDGTASCPKCDLDFDGDVSVVDCQKWAISAPGCLGVLPCDIEATWTWDPEAGLSWAVTSSGLGFHYVTLSGVVVPGPGVLLPPGADFITVYAPIDYDADGDGWLDTASEVAAFAAGFNQGTWWFVDWTGLLPVLEGQSYVFEDGASIEVLAAEPAESGDGTVGMSVEGCFRVP